MISDRSFCLDQFVRFAGLDRYPKTDQAKREVVDAMQKAFRSEEELRRVCEDLIRSSRRCPVPADFYEAAAGLHGGFEHHGKFRCTSCYDSGTVPGWFLFTYSGAGKRREPITQEQAAELRLKLGKDQALYELPVSCHCCGGDPDAKWWPNGKRPAADDQRYGA